MTTSRWIFVSLLLLLLAPWRAQGADSYDQTFARARALLMESKRPAEAYDAFRAALAQKNDPCLLLWLGRAAMEAKMNSEAIVHLTDFLARCPRSALKRAEVDDRLKVLRAGITPAAPPPAGSEPGAAAPSAPGATGSAPPAVAAAQQPLPPAALPPAAPGSQAAPARPVYRRWWFWTTIGAVAAAGAAVGVGFGVAASQRDAGLETKVLRFGGAP